MPAVIGSVVVGEVLRFDANRLIALSNAAVAGWLPTFKVFVIDSTSTCALTRAVVADACGSVFGPPRPSSLPSIKSAPRTSMTLSADEVRPAARLIESTRRIVSASVSELLTISAKFESLICVLIGSVTSEVKPLLNSATTVARAVRMLLAVSPPFI